MNNSDLKIYNELRILILRALDGTIACDEIARLEELLKSDEKYRRYYRAFMATYCNLESIMGASQDSLSRDTEGIEAAVDKEFLAILAEQEDIAPELIMEEPAAESMPEAVLEEKPHHIQNKFIRIFNIAVSVAAVLMIIFIVYANVFPPNYSVQVARVIDIVNARWDDKSEVLEKDDKVWTNHPEYVLKDGIIKVGYDNGVQVVIESPAKFQIASNNSLKLDYGRVYSVVSEEGLGFSIQTNNAEVVDLGTEFGVQVDSNGDTSVHMIKGKTILYADSISGKAETEITAGYAKKVSGSNKVIKDIYCKEEFFVRDISSSNNLIWRGQDRINLADIIGGGNGFGTGKESISIDPGTGKISNEIERENRRRLDNVYSLVPENPYIDGVFVPFGGDIPLQITSAGDIFEACPNTSGQYWMGVSNKLVTSEKGSKESQTAIRVVKLDGVLYGSKDHPGIMMHANSGITFDLNNIRTINSKKHVSRFTALCGLSDTILDTDFADTVETDMWVLIDGKVVKKYVISISSRSVYVDIPITDENRYLTLISTDGENSINGDWTFWGDPALILE